MTRHLSIIFLVCMGLAALGLAFAALNTPQTHDAGSALFTSSKAALHSTLRTADAADADAALDYYAHPPAFTHYQHPHPGLSFEYPSDFTLAVVEEEGGEVILVTNPAYGMGFQNLHPTL